MSVSRAVLLLAAAASTALLACPTAERAAPGSDAATSACARVGQRCEVSPGKLGTCVARDDCREPAGCFVCQSQH